MKTTTKQSFNAKFSKFGYKLIYKPKLFKYRLLKDTPERSRKMRKRMEKLIPKDDALICLPKNEVLIDKKIAKPGDTVLPTQVIDHFIEKSSFRAIMNYCFCRDANNCKDYPIEYGCLFMGEAARGLHPDHHRSVTKEEAREHIRKCREAGLVHLAGRANLDTIQFVIGPHDKLFTVCNCCPCCCIALATQYMPLELTDWFYKMPGVDVTVNAEECVGCEKCQPHCIFGGLEMSDEGKAVITDGCRACGRCVEACPTGAIKISFDETAVQQTIDFLSPKVDVT